MISVQDAIKKINDNTITLGSVSTPLVDSLNHFSSEDLYAPIDVPPFDNSAMDGYCFRFQDYLENQSLQIEGEIPAGNYINKEIQKGKAYRIFTGAPVILGADTVVMQEKCIVENNMLTFSEKIKQGDNIRGKGSQTQKGEKILEENTQITPSIISFLATFGIKNLKVYKKPTIGILVTGNELVRAGNQLDNGKIYESNSIALMAHLKNKNYEISYLDFVEDNESEVEKKVKEGIDNCNVLLITGGISVGNYDFVRNSLEENKVEEIFYKVKQKPGKPLYFGRKKDKFIFGLPGNPAAVVTCFNVYVEYFLRQLSGSKEFIFTEKATLDSDFYKKTNQLTYFFKAKVSQNQLQILQNQLSYQMDSFAKANAIVYLPESQTEFKEGEQLYYIKNT
ncbi:MAG: molybdopterin molybdotransferase MoeA [Flavobacteriales bacterium]|nr:molybdopterin molybdotransferase MoeA [Flavobacteriales bacterium]